jgi:CheY-like chemotaxis protein
MASESTRAPVLVVEDNTDIREAMTEILQMEGHGVVTAANGQEALEALTLLGRAPCLVLLDLSMPVMDGHEFLAHLGKEGKLSGLRILIVTADRDAALPPGTLGILRKPVEFDDLLKMVTEHCAASD